MRDDVVLGGDETINATVINNSSFQRIKNYALHINISPRMQIRSLLFARHARTPASRRRERQVLVKYLIYKLDNKRHLCVICMNFARPLRKTREEERISVRFRANLYARHIQFSRSVASSRIHARQRDVLFL